jgi:DHA2 family multidrug resistance protein
MITVGRIVKKVDNRLMMMFGFLGLAVSTWLLSLLNLDIVPSNISWPLIMSGFCTGFIFVPMTTLAMATLRQDQIHQATGLYALLRNLGASIGISLIIAMQGRSAQTHQAILAAHLTPYDLAYRQDLGKIAQAFHGMAPQSAQGMAMGVVYSQLLRQAVLLSYMDAFRWLAMIAVCCAPLAWILKKGRKPAGNVMLE